MSSKFSHLLRGLNYIKERAHFRLASGLAILFIFDILSWLGWAYPWFSSILVIIIILLFFYGAQRDLVWAVGLLLTELVVGSLGHWFNFNWGSTLVSLRLGLFLVALAIMLWRLKVKQELIHLFNHSSLWYGLALVGLVWGFLIAVARGQTWGNLFLDVNGYLYLLLWPLFLVMAQTTIWRRRLENLLKIAVIWLGLRTILLFYLYSHIEAAYLAPLYGWYRDAGLGEITFVGGNYFRIFSQSQIWSLLALVAGLAYLAKSLLIKRRYQEIIFNILFIWFNLVVVIISLSRSFWLGGAGAWLIIVLWLIVKKWVMAWRYILLTLVLLLASVGATLFINRLPWPAVPSTSNNVLATRFSSDEAAGASRLNLLKPLLTEISSTVLIGRGFGASLTYHTKDPRLLAGTAGGSGLVTTYAFEWGYLDMWLKLGLIGLAALFSFLLYRFYFSFKNWWRTASMDGSWWWPVWLALLIVNITTPYLNHPLGLGAIMLILIYVIGHEPAEINYDQ